MANIIFHSILIISLFITGCASRLPPPPSSILPARSLVERIDAVENRMPVKGWFKWSEETLVDRMEHYNVPGVSLAVINNDEIEQADGVEVYCLIHTLTMMESFL